MKHCNFLQMENLLNHRLQKICLTLLAAMLSVVSYAQFNLSNYTLTFSDEFNGTSLDATKWNPNTFTSNYIINNELQGYQPENVSVSGGYMRFLAEKRNNTYGGSALTYASGMVQTYNRDYGTQKKFAQKFGYFEASFNIPAGRGLWPAFWLLPTVNTWPPEIDIMENLGHDPFTIHMTQHYGTWPNNFSNGASHTSGSSYAVGNHTYAVDWQSTYIRWYIDGVFMREVTTNVPQQEMFVLINLAVGGNWPGSPDASTVFPSVMSVDYIRCYQLNGAGGGTTTGTNIAPSGTGYRWSRNSSETSNGNRAAAPGIDDGNLTTDVLLNNGVNDNANAFEAAGVVWSASQNGVNKVDFINAAYNPNENGVFSSNLTLQSSSNGKNWANVNGWTLSPAYSYNSAAAGGTTYTFSGPALSNIRGLRIVGKVRTSTTSGSKEAGVREVRAYTGATARVAYSPTAEMATTELVDEQKTNIVFPNPVPLGEDIQIQLPTANDKYSVSVTNELGKVVTTVDGSGNNIIIPSSRLGKTGAYFIKINATAGTTTHKIMVE